MTRPVERGSRVVDVDALKRRHEPVRIALTALLAVCDDVQACTLLVADGEQRGVVLRLVEKSGQTCHNSRARTRGGKRSASLLRSISQFGCA